MDSRRLKDLDALIKEVDARACADHQPLSKRLEPPDFGHQRKLNASERWRSLLWNIDQAEANGRDGLLALTLALGRMVQAELMSGFLFEAREHRKPPRSPSELLWPVGLPVTATGISLSALPKEQTKTVVDLAETPIFPEPWCRWRLHTAMANIGTGRPWGPWKQDKKNHHGIAWMPWPIVWVDNGNHSAAAAMLQGRGKFTCAETIDLSPVLDAVMTDGRHWFRTNDRSPFAKVRSLPMSGIFVIGQRLLATSSDRQSCADG